MRLRLRIERNALPPTRAIWPVKEGKNTIAQLLQHVNDVFPLEGATWGLEDYSVTVGGYECLHYHELDAVCRDEDEVVIRPLQYVDVRARTLTGRDQIAADGRHLVDGVPFGRPCLKAPVRPEVRIPPRKKRKLIRNGEEEAGQLMITQNGEEVEDEDDDEEQDDEDFEEDETSSDESSSQSESDDSDGSANISSDSESSSSDSDSSSDSTSDSEPWGGIPSSTQTTTPKKFPGMTNGINDTGSSSSPTNTGAKRKRKADEDDDGGVDGGSKVSKVNGGLPHQGKVRTTDRNNRRRDANQLKYLKRTGVLPQNADFSALREWQNGNGKTQTKLIHEVHVDTKASSDSDTDSDSTSGPLANGGAKRQRLRSDADSKFGTEAVHQSETLTKKLKTRSQSKKSLEGRNQYAALAENLRQELMADIASGGIDVTESLKRLHRYKNLEFGPETDRKEDEPPEEISSKQMLDNAAAEARTSGGEQTIDETVQVMDAPVAARRSKLDVASSKRLLFGSLGLRVPKTQEERDLVQKKLAQRPMRSANGVGDAAAINGTSTGAEIATEIEEIAEDPEAWREKLIVTAIECCDVGVKLSAPPFPFRQRWDPQYNKKRKRNSSKYMNNSKSHNGKQKSNHTETYDKYNINENGDALEYDDVVDEEEYWEDGALLGDAEEDEAEIDGDDGFPSLLATLGELQQLTAEEAQEGDFITFTELACDESTAWQPKMVTRTARIVEAPVENKKASDPWIFQLANRDIKAKVFDDEGNRVYSKFDMPDDDEAEDEGLREISWSELADVKLVSRSEVLVEE